MITLKFVSSPPASLSNHRFIYLTAFSTSSLEFLWDITNLTGLLVFLPNCRTCNLPHVNRCQPCSPSCSTQKPWSDPWLYLSFTAYTQFVSKSCWLYSQNVFKTQLPSHELCCYHQATIISHLDSCNDLLTGLCLWSCPYGFSSAQSSQWFFSNVSEIMLLLCLNSTMDSHFTQDKGSSVTCYFVQSGCRNKFEWHSKHHAIINSDQ